MLDLQRTPHLHSSSLELLSGSSLTDRASR